VAWVWVCAWLTESRPAMAMSRVDGLAWVYSTESRPRTVERDVGFGPGLKCLAHGSQGHASVVRVTWAWAQPIPLKGTHHRQRSDGPWPNWPPQKSSQARNREDVGLGLGLRSFIYSHSTTVESDGPGPHSQSPKATMRGRGLGSIPGSTDKGNAPSENVAWAWPGLIQSQARTERDVGLGLGLGLLTRSPPSTHSMRGRWPGPGPGLFQYPSPKQCTERTVAWAWPSLAHRSRCTHCLRMRAWAWAWAWPIVPATHRRERDVLGLGSRAHCIPQQCIERDVVAWALACAHSQSPKQCNRRENVGLGPLMATEPQGTMRGCGLWVWLTSQSPPQGMYCRDVGLALGLGLAHRDQGMQLPRGCGFGLWVWFTEPQGMHCRENVGHSY
jgi:hypothetical protein